MASASRLKRSLALGVAVLIAASACGTLSVEDEKQLGRQAQREVRARNQLFRDRVVVHYIRSLGEQLVRAAEPSPFEFRFYIVEDDDINAFALPGGALYVNTGLILRAANVSELAAVMAHEIGHVTARHVAHLYRRQRNTGLVAQLAAIAIAIVSGNPYIANAGSLATGIAATAYASTFNRQAEREADHLAVETLIRAGYDPHGMYTIFQTLREETGGGSSIQFLSSHPATDERLASVRADIARHELPSNLRSDDGGRLEIIQERVRLLLGTDAPGEEDSKDASPPDS
ncbi:MAG: M48 family metallopeptidase [Myxococcota bacterium]